MKICSLLLVLVILGCNSTETSKKETNHPEKSEVEFNPQDFIIGRECLGKIKIGQKISEAEKLLMGFNKKEEEASFFGICGGGKAYLYYRDSTLMFALVPFDLTDTILNIIAIDRSLKTSNGLNPKSTVKEINQVYPAMMVNLDLSYDGEYFYDNQNHWIFSFLTDEDTRIGKYKNQEDESNPVKPYNTKIKCDYILIESIY